MISDCIFNQTQNANGQAMQGEAMSKQGLKNSRRHAKSTCTCQEMGQNCQARDDQLTVSGIAPKAQTAAAAVKVPQAAGATANAALLISRGSAQRMISTSTPSLACTQHHYSFCVFYV